MNAPLSSFENHLPRRVITGRGASESLVELCRANGWRQVFLVSDTGVAGAGLTQRVSQPLLDAHLLAGTFAEVPPEPPIDVVDKIADRIKASGADLVIALGGGSVMDAAKVAALCARHGRAAREFLGIRKAGARGLPTILIPTTAGTGSEATFVAILTDQATGNKVGVVDPCILADIAIVDPALTDGLPAHVTAAAGMDALVHALALPLGGRFHIPHGVITGCFAGEMMRHNAPVCAADFADFSTALGWGPLSTDAFAEKLDAIADSIGLRSALKTTLVPAEVIPAMAADAVANRRLMDPNPRDVTAEDAARIYQAVLSIQP